MYSLGASNRIKINMNIILENITKYFISNSDRQKVIALENLSLEIKESEFLCIVGPSGCGKSTVINLIAGFISPDKGKILLGKEEIASPDINRIVVFQDHAVFPWKTVNENIGFGLSAKLPDQQKNIIIKELVSKMGLDGFENKFPNELSGGMRQRVAIARALAVKPKIILMDEPFSSVDQQTRDCLQEELLRLQNELKQTIVFVTHNIEEAMFLGDRVAVLSQRPGFIKEIFSIPFTRPRSPDLRNKIEFLEIKHKIWHLLRKEGEKQNKEL